MALVGLKVFFIFKCKGHYRSPVLRQTLEKMIDREFSLPLGEFYIFCVYLMYMLHVASFQIATLAQSMLSGS